MSRRETREREGEGREARGENGGGEERRVINRALCCLVKSIFLKLSSLSRQRNAQLCLAWIDLSG